MAQKALTMDVAGMSCEHCKKAVEEALMTLEGVEKASVDLSKNIVEVNFDTEKTSEEDLKEAITAAGYEVQ
ncbi:MAG: copper ion binding protein [Clostridiales bacterium]|jgi:copper chaperone|nr:copper ion binding protein [Clostridiales bacterium]